jgi:hypothetical protein
MKKLGCLVVVVIVAILAFLYRDGWIRILPGGKRDSAAVTERTWQPLTPEGAKRTQAALSQLRAPRGPVYATVAPGDLAAYILQELAKSLPPSADSIEAAAMGERLFVRAVVNTHDLGGSGALGPLSVLLGERERIQLGGTLRILRPGFAELAVKEAKIGNLNIPQALIPRLIHQISRGVRPPELSADGLPLQTPEYIGDIRVSNGKVTLYKAVSGAR